MKKNVLLAAVASVALLASVAQADTNVPAPVKMPESGWYVVGGLGVGYFVTSFMMFREHSVGPMLMLGSGYKFNKHFALELDFPINFYRAHGYFFNEPVGTYTRVDSTITLNAKFIQPLSDRWDLYEKLGLGAVAVFSADKTGSSAAVGGVIANLGLGVDYQLTSSLAVGMEVSSVFTLPLIRPAVTANLTYYFGS